MSDVLITGITGFVGSHLAEYLLGIDQKIYGLARWRAPRGNISAIEKDVEIIEGDLVDFPSMLNLIRKTKPDFVFHLAAQSYVPYSFAAPVTTLETNCLGTCNLLEAIKIVKNEYASFDPVVHICSSSEVYGQVTDDQIPITEDCPFRPASPYAVSKVTEDMLGWQYFTSWGVKTIRSRMFTHSISYDSPVIIRDGMGLVDILPISDIRKAREKMSQEIWDFEDSDLEVWDGQQFTKILNITAHRLNSHKLLQIDTHGSIVQVTNNHSIFDNKDNVVDAGDLKVNDKIAVREMPQESFNVDSTSSEFAWLLGFLVAEGCVKENRKICFSNNDEECNHTINVLNAEELYMLFDDGESDFAVYTKCFARSTGRRHKKVPKIILNSTLEIQRSFLDGYNTGDGRKNTDLESDFQEFKTSSPVLACGLLYLINRTTEQEYTLNCEERILSTGKMSYYYSINLCSNSEHARQETGRYFCKDKNSIKKIITISESAGEMVYDIETESHAFSCGIGSVKVHNTGPRRGEPFVVSTFAKQIAEAEINGGGKILVGNLDSVRTFADVRDTVRAYWMMINQCEPGEVYNIGGNETMTVREMLDILVSMSKVKVDVVQDPTRLRPSDVTLQIPCCDKFKAVTGWEPEIPFSQTLEDTLDYWREQCRRRL